jgi:hypothetical protein
MVLKSMHYSANTQEIKIEIEKLRQSEVFGTSNKIEPNFQFSGYSSNSNPPKRKRIFKGGIPLTMQS